jgi:hypothetical protein
MPSSRMGPYGRQRGGIDALPSGAPRVPVYAGVDPVTKRRHDLVEIVPSGPQAERKARAVRDRLVGIARVEAREQTDDGEAWIGDFELEVSEPGSTEPAVTLRWWGDLNRSAHADVCGCGC